MPRVINSSGQVKYSSSLYSPMTALGDLISGGAGGALARTAGDTSNIRKFLRELSVAGVAQAPVWDTIAAGDISALAPTKISTQTAATSAQLDFTSGLTGFTVVEFRLKNIVPVTNSVQLYFRLSSNAGVSFVATNYSYQQWGVNNASGTGAAGSGGTTATEIRMGDAGISNTAGGGISGSVWVCMGDGSNLAQLNHHLTSLTATTTTTWTGGGIQHVAAAYNAARFILSGGSISTGSITAYGYP